MSDIENRVKNIIREILTEEGINIKLEIKEDTRLKEDLEYDSLMLAVLTVKIENDFGIDIFEDGLIFTVGDIFNKLEGQK